tara:strand:+ start:193 stop:339 length:147 start_codon:yes stop_codon:yes gene_type:complete
MLKKIMNACGCVDIKIVLLLFFVLAIIFYMYGSEINSMITGEDCQCGN